MVQKVEEKSIWDKLGTIDYRLIYATFTILILIPLIMPIGIPVRVSSITEDYYNAIMNVPEGGVIMYRQSVSIDVWIDTGSMFINTFHILWSIPAEKGITIIMIQAGTDSLLKVHDLLAKECKPPPQWKLNENWFDLGYVPGLGDAGTVAFLRDFKNMAERDYYGTQIYEIPAVQKAANRAPPYDVVNGYDIDLLIWCSWGCTDPDWYVRQYWTSGTPPYHIPQLFQTIGNCVPNTMPYLGADRPIRAYLAGATGAAELESLTGYKSIDAPGTMIADSLSLAGLATVGFMILGNLSYFGKRFLEKKKE